MITRKAKRCGLSLLELLVVTAIIGLLAGLLTPVLRAARNQGASATCINNLRQLYLANSLYADENQDLFVLASEAAGVNLKRWHGTRSSIADSFDPSKGPLSPYLGKSGRVKLCPVFKPVSGFEEGCGGYGYNQYYVGGVPGDWENTQRVSRGKIVSSSEIAMFSDAALAYPQGPIQYSFIEPPYMDWGPPTGILPFQPLPSVHFRHAGQANVVWCDGHVSAEKMSQTQSGPNVYGGNSAGLRIGWFGPLTENAYWRVP